MKKAILLFFFLLSQSFASIYEIQNMNKITEKLSGKKTLLIFDLDNTLIMPKQTLGSDQWFGYLVKSYVKNGLNERDAIDKAIVIWEKVQSKTKVNPVESYLPFLFNELQNAGYIILGLTARPSSLGKVTRSQLLSLKIDFNKSPILSQDFVFADNEVSYQKGVIFVGPHNNKGIVLQKFLSQYQIKPNKIVFVDDKLKHVESLENVFKESQVEYIGFRYGAADKLVNNFSAELANKQFIYFSRHGVLLDDNLQLAK